MELTRFFKNLSKSDVALAGGKGASLGEMTSAGIPVPNGFVILSESFEKFLEETDLNVEVDSILHSVNHKEMESIEVASEKIKSLILNAKMPKDIEIEIKKSFKTLDANFVAVRSSATSEDSASAAWAGQLDSFLNTKENTLLENVKRCWASLFTPRAIFYRFEKGLHNTKISVAVVVQKMVNSQVSGIAFSVHPVTQNYNQLIIEAGFGLGEAIVSGQITPDSYVVEKVPRRIIDKNIIAQERGLFKIETGGSEWKSTKEHGAEQKLSDKQIMELTEIILKIEKHYGFPCDIEWAYEGKKFYIVQSRPITTLTVVQNPAEGSNGGGGDFLEIESILWRKKEISQVPGYILPLSAAAESTRVMQKQLGFSYSNFLFQYEEDSTDMIYFSDDFAKIYKELNLRYRNDKDYYKKLKYSYESDFEKNYLFYLTKKKQWLNSANNKDLFRLFSLATELVGYSVGVAHFIEAVSMTQTHPLKDQLSKKIKDPKELVYVLTILTTPGEVSFISSYQLALKKAFETKGKINQVKLLKKILKDYYWIKNGFFGKKKLTIVDLVAEKNKLGKIKVPDFLEIIAQKRKVIKKYALDAETVELAELLSFLAVLQDRRKKNTLRAIDELGIVVTAVAKKLGVDEKELLLLAPSEVYAEKFLENKFREELAGRKKYSLVVYSGAPAPNSRVYFGEENKKRIHRILEEKKQNNTNSIYGTCASTGKAIGRVRICRNLDQIDSFEEGSVLVASMTRPEFLPAMNKAVAIVTDEGGLTSHAAIIARELGIPCIIGTKNATKVLKDGDLVEVNANHAVVTIIEKAK